MGRRASTDQETESGNIAGAKDNFPLEAGWTDISTMAFNRTVPVGYAAKQPLALFENAIPQYGAGRVEEPGLPTLPMLGKLVAGADRCAIFCIDPVTHQFSFEAVANLSQEFMSALIYQGEIQCLVATAERDEPHLIIHLPDNRQFRSLWKLAKKEGIQSLWLVPWRNWSGNVSGGFLFFSGEVFSPGKEARALVSLLAVLMSAVHRRGYHCQKDGEIAFDSSGELNRVVAIEDTMPRLSQTFEGYYGGMFEYVQKIRGAMVLPKYADKRGVPERKAPAEPEVVSVLSHELLSPITLIKGYSATLLQLNDVITEKQKKQYLQGIESATNRVIRLLENLRDISRLGEKDALVTEPSSLPRLLRQTVSEIQSQTTKHVLRLCSCNSLPLVRVDPPKIQQVMTNLLVNAVKYSPEGGDIEVTIRLVRDESKFKELFGEVPLVRLPCLVVSVADSGIGIPEDELGRIFERFYRINNRLTRTVPGAGLGLYICRTIVEAHGGRIWARNRRQGGSVFSLSLPVD